MHRKHYYVAHLLANLVVAVLLLKKARQARGAHVARDVVGINAGPRKVDAFGADVGGKNLEPQVVAIVLELVGSLVRKRAVGVQCCGVSSCRYQSAR